MLAGWLFRIASTQQWVSPPDRVPTDEDAIMLLGTMQGDVIFEYSVVPGSSWNQTKLDAATVIVQEDYLDQIVLRSELPDSDPDKWSDPALPHKFWRGDHLVYRAEVLSDLAWSAETSLTFLISDITPGSEELPPEEP